MRSIFDRTLFVLGRAATAAAPAGAAIWALANISVGGASLLQHAADALDPVGRLLGMDGAILLAFLFSASVGIIFGWAPARKASRLNPIDALRSM